MDMPSAEKAKQPQRVCTHASIHVHPTVNSRSVPTPTQRLVHAAGAVTAHSPKARPSKTSRVSYGQASHPHHGPEPLTPAPEGPHYLAYSRRPVPQPAFPLWCHFLTASRHQVSWFSQVPAGHGGGRPADSRAGESLWAEAGGGSAEDETLSCCQSCHPAHRKSAAEVMDHAL